MTCDVCGTRDIYGSSPGDDVGRRDVVHHMMMQSILVGTVKSFKIDLCIVCLEHFHAGEWAALADRAEHYG